MKTFKEYQDLKHKIPSIETVFGSHSQKKDDNEKHPSKQHEIPSIETVFGNHSGTKHSIQEDSESSTDAFKRIDNGPKKESSIHKSLAPIKTDKLNDDELEAVKDYSDESMPINGILHQHDGGHVISDKKKQTYGSTVANLDSALEKHKTTGDMHVFTGIRFSPAKHFTKVNGVTPDTKKVYLPAFVSTSTSLGQAKGFSDHVSDKNDAAHGINSKTIPARHTLKIHVPEGTNAMSLKKHSFAPAENEVLLARGHTLEIHKTPEHIGDNNYVWHAKIVGHDKADLSVPK